MVAIKNMEFPKYCDDCRFCIDSFGYCNWMDEKIPGYDFFRDGNKKPDFCPLVEVKQSEEGDGTDADCN